MYGILTVGGSGENKRLVPAGYARRLLRQRDAFSCWPSRCQRAAGALHSIEFYFEEAAQVEEANFRAFETCNGLVREVSVCEEELEELGEWVALHTAIEKGDAAVVQAALRACDVSGLSRTEELCESLEVRGARHEVWLQQLIAGLEPIEQPGWWRR